MMLIVALGAISVILLVTGILVDNFSKRYDGFEFKFASGVVAGCFVLSILPAIIIHVSKEADIAGYTQRYNSLVYQYENDLYDNDNDVGKKELMKEIQDWNELLATGKAMRDNKWLSVYYPKEFYDNFDFIKID